NALRADSACCSKLARSVSVIACLLGALPGQLLDDLNEALRIELPVIVVVVYLDDRCKVADAQAAVDDLHGEFAVRCGLALPDAVPVAKHVDQLLTATNEARRAVTEQHEVFARWFRSKVGV